MRKLATCVFLSIALAANVGRSQSIAHSDVFFTYGASQIEIEPQDGRLAIPQVMPTGGFFAQANTNPGFFSENDVGGGTGANDVVGYNVLEDLFLWSGGEFVPPHPETRIQIDNNPRPVEQTSIGTGTGEQRASFTPLRNSIGQSSSSGDFHAHVNFRLVPLLDDAETDPLFGAYGLKLSLSSDNEVVEESDPFFIVFQFGIEEDEFQRALDDFDALLMEVPGLPGDFDMDGVLTAVDIDWLSAEVVAGTHAEAFDLNGDELVDQLDRTQWVEGLAGSLFGDANLDGSVEFGDFLSLSTHFGSAGGWAEGDFNGDATIDFPDFLVLSNNFGQEAMATSVPEPTGWALTVGVAGLLAARRSRRRKPDACGAGG